MIALKSIENGWIELHFAASRNVETKMIRLASKTCDPPSDLAIAVLNIAAVCGKNSDITTIAPHFIFWEVKPQLYTCSLAPAGDETIAIELHHCPDMYAGIHTTDELRLCAVIHLSDLTANLFEEMRGLLLQHGFVGYRHRWGRDFPLALLVELYKLLNPDVATTTADINGEFRLLQTIFNFNSWKTKQSRA